MLVATMFELRKLDERNQELWPLDYSFAFHQQTVYLDYFNQQKGDSDFLYEKSLSPFSGLAAERYAGLQIRWTNDLHDRSIGH